MLAKDGSLAPRMQYPSLVLIDEGVLYSTPSSVTILAKDGY